MRVARVLKPGRELRDTITLLRHRITLAFDTRAFLVAGYARMHVCAWMNTQQSGAGLPDRHGSVVPTASKVGSKSLVDICIFRVNYSKIHVLKREATSRDSQQDWLVSEMHIHSSTCFAPSNGACYRSSKTHVKNMDEALSSIEDQERITYSFLKEASFLTSSLTLSI